MRDRSVARDTALKIVAAILATAFFLFACLLGVHLWEQKQSNKQSSPSAYGDSVLKYNGKEYALKDNVETLLIMGLDKFEGDVKESSYNNDRQADFIMLLVIDNEKSCYYGVQINRDTMAEVNILGVNGQKVDSVTKQIALAHTYGNGKKVSGRNVADSVSKMLLDVNVNHYVSVTMDAVPVMNDLVGGVEIEVLDDFTGIDSTLKKGEKVTLRGEHALNYVRTRYGLEDSSNQNRMNRQRQYLDALFDKTKQQAEKDPEFIAKTTLKMSDYIVSNRSATALQTTFDKISEYEYKGIKEIDGKLQKGEEFMEFYPDKTSVKQNVIDLFYEEKK